MSATNNAVLAPPDYWSCRTTPLAAIPGCSCVQWLDAVRELTTPPEPPERPIGFVTHEDKKDKPKGNDKTAKTKRTS